jgi:hypothetical protein
LAGSSSGVAICGVYGWVVEVRSVSGWEARYLCVSYGKSEGHGVEGSSNTIAVKVIAPTDSLVRL